MPFTISSFIAHTSITSYFVLAIRETRMKQSIVSTISVMLLSSLVTAQAQEQATEAPAPAAQPAEPAAPTPPAPPAPPAPKAATPEKKQERITVTGSRINRIQAENATPVTTYGRDELDRSGYANVSDFIRNKIPTASMSTENETLTQSAGSASFAGRDAAAEYTLVLVNGRRLPTNAIAEDFVDLNLIPIAAIDRIEYLKDGASAIYGSDAVAGVLNIITKKSFEGTSVSTRFGQSHKGDGQETSVQVVSGASNERSNFLIAGDLFKREPVKARNRPLINSSISPKGEDSRSPNGLPGYVIRADGTIQPFSDCPPDRINARGQCLFDVAPLYQAVPKTERQSVFTIFDHQLTDDVQFFGEARYSRTYTRIANGAAPGGVDVAATAPSNTFGEDIFLVRRYLDFGPRVSDNYNNSFNLVGGFRGTIMDSVNWEVSVAKHRLQNQQQGVSGMIHSSTASQYFNDGTLNPFVYNVADTAAKQAAFAAIQANTFRVGQMDLEVYNLNFDGQAPVALPGGNIGYAFGYEYRNEEFADRSDLASTRDEILGAAGGDGKGKQMNTAVYLELDLPVLESLDWKLAARNDNIDTNTDRTTYNTAIQYRPLDSWLVRASYGTGFKAPGLHYRFLNQSFGVDRVRDPVACAQFGECTEFEVNAKTGGNPALEPEESVFWNVGTGYQFSKDISAVVDYWSLEINDIIGELSTQEILNNEASYPDLVTRVDGRLTDPASFVQSNYQNLTKQKSAGLELGVDYNTQVGPGRVLNSVKVNKLLVSKGQTSAIQPLCNYANDERGVNGNLTTSYAMDSWAVGTDIRYYGPVQTYSGGFEPGTCKLVSPESRYTVKSTTEVALNGSYTIVTGTQFTAGIQNVFNLAPPFDPNTNGGWPWYNQQRYSNMGRYYYLGASHTFN